MKYQVFGILWTVFNLALMLVMGIVGIYLLWLVIKALRVYINSHEVREEKKATRKSLAEALRENRVRCKMTQEFVSETIGVSRQAVSKWENGTSDPNTSNLIALAKLYGISAEELLKNVEHSAGTAKPNEGSEKTVYKKNRACTPFLPRFVALATFKMPETGYTKTVGYDKILTTEPECAGKQKDSGTPQQEDARRAEKGKV